jgi:release factor glutamine methyltransferase
VVDRRVLIPRPETEGVVEAALTIPEGGVAVDVGTGSGAIALALKAERPDLHLIATDLSDEALAVAAENASALGLDVEFHHGDLLSEMDGQQIDAVLSNPPYVTDGERSSLAPEILRYEPVEALFAGQDGLDVYRRLVPQIGSTAATFAALEVGMGQAPEVAKMFKAEGFPSIAIHKDLAGIERVVVAERD